MILHDWIKGFWFIMLLVPLILAVSSCTISFLSRGRKNPELFTDFQYNLWKWTPKTDRTFQDGLWSYIVYGGVGGFCIVGLSDVIIKEGVPLLLLIPVCIVVGLLVLRFLFDVQHNLSINKTGDSARMKEMEDNINAAVMAIKTKSDLQSDLEEAMAAMKTNKTGE